MKQIFFIMTFFLCFSSYNLSIAQNNTVLQSLKSKYSNVSYSSEGGGWYLGTYSIGTTKYIAFFDKTGKVICNNITNYKKYPGWINLLVIDPNSQKKHDNWIEKMKAYRRQLSVYNNAISEYNEEVEDYNTKVSYAREEATNRWRAAQAEAERRVRKEWEQTVKRNSTNLGSALSTGAALGVAIGNAKGNIRFETYLRQVLGERDLAVAPRMPNVSKPIEPSEPKIESKWVKYTYLQPCPFEELEFDNITTENGFAIAKQNGKYGVVNSTLETIVPFSYDIIAERNGYYILSKDNKYGIYQKNGVEVYPCIFNDVSIENENNRTIILNKKDSGWGAIDMVSKQELVKNQYEKISLDQLDPKRICFHIVQNGKWGICSENGEIILNTLFDEVTNRFLVNTNYWFIESKKDGLCNLYTTDGKEFVTNCTKWEWLSEPFLRIYTNDHKIGIVGMDKPDLVPAIYDQISWNEDLHAFIVTRDKEMGVLTIDGQIVIKPFMCNNILYTKSNEYLVFQNSNNISKYGACDFQGNIIVEPKYKYESIDDKALKVIKKLPATHSVYENALLELEKSYNNEKDKLGSKYNNVLKKISNPSINKKYDSSLKVLSVVITNNQTILTMSSTTHYEQGWMNIDKNAYIVANGKQYKMNGTQGIEYSPNYTYFSYKGESKTFTLFFPAIPKNTTSIDFIENESGEWRLYGIQLE